MLEVAKIFFKKWWLFDIQVRLAPSVWQWLLAKNDYQVKENVTNFNQLWAKA